MATLATTAVRDNSTLANFKQWAQVISNFMTTAGWSKSSDTGQVNWATIASVPAVNTYVYEIWKPGDALTTFYLKIEYGTNSASANTGPQMRFSVGTSTNGAGVLSGFIAGPFIAPWSTPVVTSTVTQWNCYLSGDTGRIGVAMWVNDTTNAGGPCFFAVARSKNSSGSNTSSHVSLIVTGGTNNSGNWSPCGMQAIVFGTGVANAVGQSNNLNSGSPASLYTRLASNLFASTDVPIGPVFPCIGFYDNPLIEVASAAANDITDQASFTISAANMPYGTAHTFIGFKATPFDNFPNVTGANMALVMLYE